MTTDSEEELTRRLSAIRTAGRLFSSSLVLQNVLDLVMDKLIELTGAERGFVMLLDEQAGNMEFKAARNVERATIEQPSFQISRNVVNQVIREGKAICLEDASSDAEYSHFQSVASLKLRSIACAPLQVKGRAIGAIYVENRVRTHLFDEADLELLTALADEAAIAIENARLFGDLEARMSEIAQMKDYQDSIFRSVGSAIISLDLTGKVTVLNAAAEQIFRVSATEVVGQPYPALFGEVLSARLLGRIARAAAPGGRPSHLPELHCDLPCRSGVWLDMTISALWDVEKKPIGVVVTADDLTEGKLLEEARRKADEEKQRIRDLFGKYVAPAVAERLLTDPSRVALGGEEQTVTVLFGDIRGYTSISETLTPQDVVAMLNRYLAVGTEAIFEYEGTLDKYIGDAVMAFFNAPLPQREHALSAVQAALAMQHEVKALSAESGMPVTYGIGVNTGPAIVGNIGTERLMNYTVIGDAVNVASRIQGRAGGGEVLITDATYQLVRGQVEVDPLEPMQVKGKTEPLQVYRVLGLKEAPAEP